VSCQIHPTADVDASAQLGDGVTVGPGVIIGAQVTVGNDTRIEARAILERNVRIGERCRVGVGSVLGGDPQDVKYGGEETWVEIGPDTTIREYSTINRGTSYSGRTTVGARCFVMSYVHVAHDCHIADDVVLANGVQMAGHVEVEERAMVSGLVPIHQFVRLGTLSMVGGGSRVNQDIPPYTRAVGNPTRLVGVNSIGLERAGVSTDARAAIKRAYRLLFNAGLPRSEGIARVRADLVTVPEVERLLAFLEKSSRGVEA
jgi:UDP-N-acetylglucosamine acyltransferase